MIAKYCAQHICIGSDLNPDLARIYSQNTMALKRFVVNECLLFALNNSNSNVSHTFTSFSANTISKIDHFILTDFIFHCVKSHTT